MKRKYQMTGCARLGFFMLVFLPIVYFGVDYYQGGSGIDGLKNFFKGDKQNSTVITKERFGIQDEAELKSTLRMKDQEINLLKERIKNLEDQLARHSHE